MHSQIDLVFLGESSAEKSVAFRYLLTLWHCVACWFVDIGGYSFLAGLNKLRSTNDVYCWFGLHRLGSFGFDSIENLDDLSVVFSFFG